MIPLSHLSLLYVPISLYFLSYCLCHLLCALLQLPPSPDHDLALFQSIFHTVSEGSS